MMLFGITVSTLTIWYINQLCCASTFKLQGEGSNLHTGLAGLHDFNRIAAFQLAYLGIFNTFKKSRKNFKWGRSDLIGYPTIKTSVPGGSRTHNSAKLKVWSHAVRRRTHYIDPFLKLTAIQHVSLHDNYDRHIHIY